MAARKFNQPFDCTRHSVTTPDLAAELNLHTPECGLDFAVCNGAFDLASGSIIIDIITSNNHSVTQQDIWIAEAYNLWNICQNSSGCGVISSGDLNGSFLFGLDFSIFNQNGNLFLLATYYHGECPL